jgi:hypothetical protein
MVSYSRMAAFAGFAILISMLPSYYVFSHVVFFFGLSLGPMFWVGVILLGLLFMAGMGMSIISDNPALRGVNIALGIWVGFFFILLFLLIFYDLVTWVFVWLDRLMMGKAVMVIAAVLTVAGAVNAHFVRTRYVKVPATGLNKPVRIVLISDLHLGPVHDLRYFKKIIERTNREHPDLVLITGDLIDGRLTDEMFAPINDLKAPVYFSPGNHEHYAGMEEILKLLARTKATPLVNQKVDLGNLELAGIDFDWTTRAFDPMVAKVVPSGGKYSILMSHGPPAFDAARKAGYHLTLSGHTHGGQFWPFTGFGRIFIKYRVGMYKRDGKHLFITSGAGTWGPPLRLGVNSELAVIDIG